MKERTITPIYPRYLWFLTTSFAMVITLANWFDPRLINIFGLVTDAGTLVFPLTFLLSDLITEVYGYKQARRTIWCGFLFNALFLVYGQLVTHLPSPDFYVTQNQSFDNILAMNTRIIVASFCSYLLSEPLNSLVMAKLKLKFNGRKMGMRFLASTFMASGVDSWIFGFVAFYGVMSNVNLIELILTMWLIKVVVEALGLPLSVRLARRLKAAEAIDIYDENTKFGIFSLNSDYGPAENKFQTATYRDGYKSLS